MNARIAISKYSFYPWLIVGWQLALTIGAILLALSENIGAYIAGELLLSISILQWFILEHDFGHAAFFKSKWLNNAFGLLASLFSLLPFFPWKTIHHSHHVWTGWKDLDPTQPQKKINDLSGSLIFIINTCWKLWIPIFSLGFSLITFWNLKRLSALYPKKKLVIQNIFSVVFIVVVFALLIIFFGGFMLKCWLPSFLMYMLIADPLLLSQHTHLDYHHAEGKDVKPIRYQLQPAYTRSVIYPKWMSTYLLYHFDKHGLHHQHPGVPLYKISQLSAPEENTIYWLKWLKIAKQIPAHVLIFQSYNDTGIKL